MTIPNERVHMYGDHPELFGQVWSWTVETATHALRLILSGVSDRYPNAGIILGQLGETLPYQMWRLDMLPSEYFKRNVWVTTSGMCADAPL